MENNKTNIVKCVLKPEKPKLINQEKKLLARVVGYYQHCFNDDDSGREYLRDKGISNNQTYETFGLG